MWIVTEQRIARSQKRVFLTSSKTEGVTRKRPMAGLPAAPAGSADFSQQKIKRCTQRVHSQQADFTANRSELSYQPELYAPVLCPPGFRCITGDRISLPLPNNTDPIWRNP